MERSGLDQSIRYTKYCADIEIQRSVWVCIQSMSDDVNRQRRFTLAETIHIIIPEIGTISTFICRSWHFGIRFHKQASSVYVSITVRYETGYVDAWMRRAIINSLRAHFLQWFVNISIKGHDNAQEFDALNIFQNHTRGVLISLGHCPLVLRPIFWHKSTKSDLRRQVNSCRWVCFTSPFIENGPVKYSYQSTMQCHATLG